MYKYLYNMTLNLDVAFLLSVSIYSLEFKEPIKIPAKRIETDIEEITLEIINKPRHEKPDNVTVRHDKIQISLEICSVISECSLTA